MFETYSDGALLSALGMSYAGAAVGFCFSVVGAVMLFLPHKAWLTRYKPRWPGLLLLVGALYLLIVSLMSVLVLRQEIARRRIVKGTTGRNFARRDIIWCGVNNMLTIRGVYDGKTIRPLPGEQLPEVEGEVPVQIIFQLEDTPASRLLRIREARPPLPFPVRELIDHERAL